MDFIYDALDRLTAVLRSDGNVNISYADNGNILRRRQSGGRILISSPPPHRSSRWCGGLC